MRQPTRRILVPGDSFYLECGACREQYGAATLRSGLFSRPEDEYLDAYAAALDAFEAMEGSLASGVTSAELDRLATERLARHGLADRRLLKCGYSIGVGFAPGWGEGNVFDISPGSSEQVEAGMTLHLVLVIMLEKYGAVGLSETMLIGANGATSLTSYNRNPVFVDPTTRNLKGV